MTKHVHHGESYSRLYRIHRHMLSRCTNPKVADWHLYGGKGISVCDAWREYVPFRDWANRNGYQDGLSIDRLDSNGDYSPDNCRWATAKIQSNNTSRNRFATIDGVVATIAQHAERYGIHQDRVYNRLRYGWDVARAVTQPLRTGQ